MRICLICNTPLHQNEYWIPAAERAAELQPGVSYLHSVGRTNTPFGRNPAEVMAGCVRDDEGQPRIFPMFT